MDTAPKVGIGSKVLFDRGMFGRWEGKVEKLYKSRQGWVGHPAGKEWAVVSFRMDNGKAGRKRVSVSSLTLVQEVR